MDLFLFNFIHQFAGKLRFFDFFGVFFGEYLAYILVLAAAVFFFKQKNVSQKIQFFSLLALSAIISRGLVAEIIRFFYHRLRPCAALDFSPLINHCSSAAFPSGHMAFYFVLALAVFYFNRKWGWWFIGATALMGIARIFAGVHWPSDILAGMAIATISFFVVINFFGLVEKQKNLPL